ncbi:MAG: sporulation protein YqfD, partial [Clostridia bacterium]|nr:sporulation protein YqfD [Clostridia bacterium]
MYNIFLLIFGRLKIEISGSQMERFLNCAAKKKIPIMDLRYKNKTVTGNISPKYFLRLKDARRGIDVRIRILKKSGMIFKIKPHRERVGFIVGFLLFLTILKFLSLFVWGIEIRGNKTVKSADLAEICASLGIKNGRLQSSLDPKTLADKILLA